ncbi:MAG: sulfatase-like hydrolase/transferase [Chitinivibrionales bacterium]|nr:sulfatase-like hydrolase/transferase [Chitinivibrionales bacterium]
MKKQPNILWICSDQQRFDTLGAYGNTRVSTPNIDRLANEGALFTNAFCQNPTCAPSRASFLTGRYPRTCRQRQNGSDIPDTEVLVTKMLQDEGYYNGLSGKLHIRGARPQRGESRIDDGYNEFHWSHHTGNPKEGPNQYQQWLKEKGVTYETRPCDESRFIRFGLSEENHQTAWCSQKAMRFMRDRALDEQPWLFSVNIFDPHHPFDAPEEYVKKYLDTLEQIPLPAYQQGELETKTEFQRIDHKGAYGGHGMSPVKMSELDHRLVKASYWAMCELVDTYVGKMLDVLDATGQRENTMVIYTSDHGEMLGDHGIYWKGAYFYDCAIKVPLILNMPGAIGPQTVNELVELLDLPSTILDLAQVREHPGMQGKSLMPLLRGERPDTHHRQDIYCESYSDPVGATKTPNTQSQLTTMVRTEKFKLTVAHGHNWGELYDLEKDPLEFNNLWDNEAYKDTKIEMLLRLSDRMALTIDPLPSRPVAW